MDRTGTATTPGIDGVHAETRLRDPQFVMKGHHCHSCCEFFYVESGDCRFLIEDHIYDLHVGDFILVPPMALHYTRYLSGPCRRTVVLFRLEDILEDVLKDISDGEGFLTRAAVYQVPPAYRGQVTYCLKQMTTEERVSDEHSALMRKIWLQELLLMCSRVCDFMPDGIDSIRTTDQQVRRAARYISGHYMQPITTKEVAQAVGFSPNYLSRRFRMSAGIGLHEYLVFVRLHHAAQELITTEDSITTIALRCGFSDSNYFKDCFKKKYGVTPRQYRKLV